ncbi:conserved hypothetical protein [Beggiatoa sp. PS]|nr:conserved hypothetical protein [Beggiatoa sp. PS]
MPTGFSKLPHVKQELDSIRNEFEGNSHILPEEQFTIDKVRRELLRRTYSIVHFATHGSFENNAKDSFLLTYNDRLKMDELKQLIGIREFSTQPLELLTLSACQTAKGDDQAALGLAGVAIQAGARSALASLWSVSDAAIAELMTAFYRHLKNPKFSKAQALQEAQLELLKNSKKNSKWEHPNFWAAFLLIGNWL